MTEEVLLVHHHAGEPHDDRVTNLLSARGMPFRHIHTCSDEPLPSDMESFSALVVYGGAQNIDEADTYPFLKDEFRFIEDCLRREKPFLGLCLGAQCLAHVLGAKVGPLVPEIHEFGFYPIQGEKTGQDVVPERLHVVQAHFHGWEMPAGAERLASGETFPNQGMRYGKNAFGFQFHPEVTPSMFKRWQNSDWAPHGKPGVQDRAQQDRSLAEHEPRMAQWFDDFLGHFFNLGEPEKDA